MKKTKNLGGVLLCLVELVIGVLLLVDPHNLIATILLGLGIVLILLALSSGVRYFRTEAAVAAAGQGLMTAFLALGGGIFCIVKNDAIAKFDLLTTLFGLAILVVGLGKVQRAVDRVRLKLAWIVAAASAALTVAFAIILLTGAFGIDFWTFAGIALLVEAACDIADLIFAAVVKKKKEASAEITVEAEGVTTTSENNE